MDHVVWGKNKSYRALNRNEPNRVMHGREKTGLGNITGGGLQGEKY